MAKTKSELCRQRVVSLDRFRDFKRLEESERVRKEFERKIIIQAADLGIDFNELCNTITRGPLNGKS